MLVFGGFGISWGYLGSGGFPKCPKFQNIETCNNFQKSHIPRNFESSHSDILDVSDEICAHFFWACCIFLKFWEVWKIEFLERLQARSFGNCESLQISIKLGARSLRGFINLGNLGKHRFGVAAVAVVHGQCVHVHNVHFVRNPSCKRDEGIGGYGFHDCSRYTWHA